MLVKLEVDEITQRWNYLSGVIQASLLEKLEDDTYLLKQLISGNMLCWAIQDENEILAYVTTIDWIDIALGEKDIMIYSLTKVSNNITDEIWKDSFMKFATYAKENDYKKVVAFTVVPKILELVEMLGGNTDIRLVTIPLNN